MKRLLVILIIAPMASTVCAQTLHPTGSSPHGRIAVTLLLVCVLLAVWSAAVLISRVCRQRRLFAVREARMLQQLVAQAAALRKPMGSGVQTVMTPETKEALAKYAPVPSVAPVMARTASCYWTYQARQLEVNARS